MPMYEYPMKLQPNVDLVAVADEDTTKSHWEPVTAVYRMGQKVAVETDRQIIQCDPDKRVLFKRKVSGLKPVVGHPVEIDPTKSEGE